MKGEKLKKNWKIRKSNNWNWKIEDWKSEQWKNKTLKLKKIWKTGKLKPDTNIGIVRKTQKLIK